MLRSCFRCNAQAILAISVPAVGDGVAYSAAGASVPAVSNGRG